MNYWDWHDNNCRFYNRLMPTSISSRKHLFSIAGYCHLLSSNKINKGHRRDSRKNNILCMARFRPFYIIKL